MPAGGDIIYASDVTTTTPVQVIEVTDQTVSSTTQSPGAQVCAVAFTAPPSGRVRLSLTTVQRVVSATGTSLFTGVIVRTGATLGAGTVVFDGLNNEPGCRTVLNWSATTGYLTQQATAILEGLTAGAQYNARVEHWVGTASTSATILTRVLGVDPLP